MKCEGGQRSTGELARELADPWPEAATGNVLLRAAGLLGGVTKERSCRSSMAYYQERPART
jgi:hypothetical protein